VGSVLPPAAADVAKSRLEWFESAFCVCESDVKRNMGVCV